MSIERTDLANTDLQARVDRVTEAERPPAFPIRHVLTMDEHAPYQCTCSCGWTDEPGTRTSAIAAIDEHREHRPTEGANP
jgi:hypothetical protein